jgi:hypothetical protein
MSEWTFNSQLATRSHKFMTLAQFPIGPVKQWNCTHFCHSVPTLSTLRPHLLTADWPQLLTLHFSSATNTQKCSNLKISCAVRFHNSCTAQTEMVLMFRTATLNKKLADDWNRKTCDRLMHWTQKTRRMCLHNQQVHLYTHTHTHKFEQRTAHQQVCLSRIIAVNSNVVPSIDVLLNGASSVRCYIARGNRIPSLMKLKHNWWRYFDRM